MRLTCPNCGAQYEVDEKVIPRGGRDVQCSACGNTWYQYPMDVALQMRAAELDDDDDTDDETPPPPAGAAERVAPRIDKTVLDVLREEAEREMSERKRGQTGLETQGDLGLTRPTRSKAAPSRIYGEDDPVAPPPPPPADDTAPDTETGPVRRRNLLPDIEELTSTLEPGSERRSHDEAEEQTIEEQKQGFRRGLSLILLVALALVIGYLLAPLIADWVPALRPSLAAYVGFVDGLRLGAADLMRSLLGG